MGAPGKIRVAVNRALVRIGFPPDWFLVPLAAVVGTLAGLTAVAFDAMVRFSEDFFFGRLADRLHAAELAALIIVPALGGLAVGLLRHFVIKKPPSHGVPDVMEAIARRGGKMQGRTGVFTAITASLTIGSGGSVGEEGPIVQIGSVLGSKCGQWLKVGSEHRNTLVGCGAAAGLAAIFNAPIAGVLFVLEVLLRDFSLKTFMPIVIASVFGTAVSQAVTHRHGAVFSLPGGLQHYQFSIDETGFYILLGALCGLASFLFTRALLHLEERWHKFNMHDAVKPALGGAVLGVIGVSFVLVFGRNAVPAYEPPAFYGNGYPVIQTLLDPRWYAGHESQGMLLAFLLSTMLLKMLATSMTLGSGGSGGTFAPSLFIGATLGGATGVLMTLLGFEGLTPASLALVGMAGVLAGTAHCPLTAFLMVFEITQDYKVILPVMLVSMLATTVSQVLQRESIYTLALRERGIRVGTLSDLSVLRRMNVSQVPTTTAVLVNPMDPVQRLLDLASQYAAADYVVVDEREKYLGMVVGEDMRTTLLEREAVPLMIVAELMRADVPTVTAEETLEGVLEKFAKHDIASLPLVDDESKVLGLITRSNLMRKYQLALDSG